MRDDLRVPRPWLARPKDPSFPDGAWEVVGSGKNGSKESLLATFLCEDDAKRIAEAGRADSPGEVMP